MHRDRFGRRRFCWVVLVFVLFGGCGADEEAGRTADEAATTPADRSAGAPAAEAEAGPPRPEPPPPLLLDAMWAKVDRGEWTIEEALIANLRAVAEGDEGLEDLYGDEGVEVVELSGLLATARRYVESGEDAAARREIRQLLERIAPTPEEVRRNAAPASPGARQARLEPRRWGSDPVSGAGRTPLAGLSFLAFVSEVPSPESRSWIWTTHTNLAGRHDLYYPRGWGGGDPRLRLVDEARQALDDALSMYAALGGVSVVDLVFTETDAGATDASAGEDLIPRTDGGSACYVDLFSGIYELEGEHFRQVLAHELFHCFQAWNLSTPLRGDAEDLRWLEVTDWWVEGSAEYFSNAVYPEANLEWQFAGRFDRASPDTPLHHLSYENFLLFQFVANELGNPQIVTLLRNLPDSGGHGDQARALARWPSMQQRLHHFGQRYLDVEVADSGGGMVPVHPWPGEARDLTTTRHEFEAEPFVLKRELLRLPGTEPVELEAEESGTPGEYRVKETAREGPWEPAWSRLPEWMGAELCEPEERHFKLLMTAASGASEPYELRVELKAGEADSVTPRIIRAASGMMVGLAMRQRQDLPGQEPLPEEAQAGMECYYECLPQCLCTYPEMHSERDITLDECNRFVPGGSAETPSGRTFCEHAVESEAADDPVPSADFTVLFYCGRGCTESCGWPEEAGDRGILGTFMLQAFELFEDEFRAAAEETGP